jgi:hypothetical protein
MSGAVIYFLERHVLKKIFDPFHFGVIASDVHRKDLAPLTEVIYVEEPRECQQGKSDHSRGEYYCRSPHKGYIGKTILPLGNLHFLLSFWGQIAIPLHGFAYDEEALPLTVIFPHLCLVFHAFVFC